MDIVDSNIHFSCIAVLLVEYNPFQAEVVKAMLKPESVSIHLTHTTNLADAFALMGKKRFDAVILDLTLPDCEGIETFKRFYKFAPEIPVIVMTRIEDDEIAVNALSLGAQDYLIKDHTNSYLLIRAIRHAIERRRIVLQLEKRTRDLETSKQRLHWLIEHSPIPLFEIDLTGAIELLATQKVSIASVGNQPASLDPAFFEKVIPSIKVAYANRIGLELLHAESIESLRNLRPILTAEACLKIAAALEELMNDKSPTPRDLKMKRLDGKLLDVTMSYARTPTDPGEPVYVIVSIVDHTQQKKDEEQQKLQAAAMESTTYAIAITDADGSIIWVNPAFVSLTGYPREEVVGLNPRVLKSGEHREDFYRDLWQTILGGDVWSGDIRNRRKDGTLYTEHMTITPVKDEDESISHFVAIKEDITEKLTLETQLVQAQKLESIGQLAAGIAHEINTPIQFVGDNTKFMSDSFDDLSNLLKAYHRLLEASKTGSVTENMITEVEAARVEADVEYLEEEIPKAIDQSLEGIERVAKIVRAMKEFSHPGQQQKTPADINSAIENTTTISRNEWKYVADLKLDFTPDLPEVYCLPGELNQVFLNMIVNAAHAIEDVVGDGSQEKGTIKISTRAVEDSVEIRISDSGSGIPESVQSRVFDPFYTTKEVGKGSGQGLAIARSVIVDKHQGTIEFETKTGQGTTFVIKIPISPQTENKQAEKAAPGVITVKQ